MFCHIARIPSSAEPLVMIAASLYDRRPKIHTLKTNITISEPLRKEGVSCQQLSMAPLAAHPIFRISDGPASPNLGHIRRNTVAFKGTEVYVAVGSTVRYAELREWFAMDEETQDRAHYQVLLTFIR